MIPASRPGRDDRGSASAEFAVALPALIVAIALGIGALAAASAQVRLQDAAADAARLVARGEPDRAGSVVGSAVPGAASSIGGQGDLVCVTASAEVRLATLAIPLAATSCALEGGL
ncbi:TadE family type IV pilus minor pilin [Microbacterium karelineae]|uniref:TadE family type IV pilus minor pilin n=1 Tax=Microbacterium karelineae TaxID=2654283 RepID=UPI0012E9B00E|nr:TadE family type IV pilus minor pilin [Microbacterium karelineae]